MMKRSTLTLYYIGLLSTTLTCVGSAGNKIGTVTQCSYEVKNVSLPAESTATPLSPGTLICCCDMKKVDANNYDYKFSDVCKGWVKGVDPGANRGEHNTNVCHTFCCNRKGIQDRGQFNRNLSTGPNPLMPSENEK